jgi:hypothetical protein
MWSDSQPSKCSGGSSICTQSIIPFRLGSLTTLYFEKYTDVQLSQYLKAANLLPDDTHDIWRFRIIYLLASDKRVFCINFIPENPSKGQIVQVMRLKDEEDVSQYQEYNHEYPTYKCILPVKRADQFFDLSKCEISEAVAHLTPRRLIPIVKKALEYLSSACYLKGLALTLKDKVGKQIAYVWLK